jgi:serine/threonine-protein kinase
MWAHCRRLFASEHFGRELPQETVRLLVWPLERWLSSPHGGIRNLGAPDAAGTLTGVELRSHWRRRVIGKQLGHYKIISQLGRGGMASVFKAEQLGLGRLVALKILQPSLAADEVIVQRFQQEARIAANLHHAHIVTIYDVGEVEGVYYIAMRHIEGENLGQMLRREGPLPPARALGVLEQVAEALDFAHSRTILHRDIKPANVMVEPGDALTLTDFGIARAGEASHLTATRMVIGTPEYMSPEQARGDVVDKRSDLYALGVLMYEALGGRPPFSAASTPSLLYLHVHEPPPPLHQLRPDLPRALSDVVSKALAKDPNDRYQSGREMVAAVRAALAAPPPTIVDQPPTAGYGAATVADPNPGRGPRPMPGTPVPAAHPTPAPQRPTPPGRRQPRRIQNSGWSLRKARWRPATSRRPSSSYGHSVTTHLSRQTRACCRR